MKRRFESDLGRVAGYVGLFLLLALVSSIVIGLLDSNLIWGEDNQYGRVDVPATEVVHFPAKTFNASVAVLLPGRGNQTPDLPLPKDLSMTIKPVDGGAAPVIERDLGTSVNANDKHDDTQIRVWKVTIPAAGDYRVTTDGDFLGIGVNVQMWFGHDGPLPGNVWLWGIGAALVEMFLIGAIWPLLKKRKSDPYQEADEPGMWQTPPPQNTSDIMSLQASLEQARDNGDFDEVERLKAKITRIGGVIPPDRPARTS